MAVKLTKKGILVIAIVGLLLIGGSTGYILWRVQQNDTVAPTESEAGGVGGDGGDDPCDKWDYYKRYQCCDGTWICEGNNDNITKVKSGKTVCGTLGYQNCDGPAPQACSCESFTNCGVNCWFPAGTQSDVDKAVKGTCGKKMAFCIVEGSKTKVEIRNPGACWSERNVCKNPVAEEICTPETAPPSCQNLTLVNEGQEFHTNVVSAVDDSLLATVTASDPDGVPKKIRMCYAIKGQSNDFYKVSANWSCGVKENTATISSRRTFEGFAEKYVSTHNTFTVEQVLHAGLTFMTEITDDTDGTICTSNPAITTGNSSVLLSDPSISCGAACVANITLQAATCGDGTVDPGEECDPAAVNTCDTGACQADCTCPNLNPGFNIQKVGLEQCIEGNETYADVRYTITVTNNGETAGHITQIQDLLDAKVQDGWIIGTTVTPSTGLTVTSDQILWDLDTTAQTFDPGESMQFTYTIRIPETAFAMYTNTATAIVSDEGEDNVSAQSTIDVDCEITPITGLFDSTKSRIILASVLLLAGAYYAKSNQGENITLNLFGRFTKLDKKRKDFEKKV